MRHIVFYLLWICMVVTMVMATTGCSPSAGTQLRAAWERSLTSLDRPKDVQGRSFSRVDVEVLPYVESFLADARRFGITEFPMQRRSMIITVEDLSQQMDLRLSNAIGACWRPTGLVILDKKYWNGAGHYDRKYLVYHELGHCLLHRAHTGPGVRSLMSPHLEAVQEIIHQEERYLTELFTTPATPANSSEW